MSSRIIKEIENKILPDELKSIRKLDDHIHMSNYLELFEKFAYKAGVSELVSLAISIINSHADSIDKTHFKRSLSNLYYSYKLLLSGEEKTKQRSPMIGYKSDMGFRIGRDLSFDMVDDEIPDNTSYFKVYKLENHTTFKGFIVEAGNLSPKLSSIVTNSFDRLQDKRINILEALLTSEDKVDDVSTNMDFLKYFMSNREQDDYNDLFPGIDTSKAFTYANESSEFNVYGRAFGLVGSPEMSLRMRLELK